MATLAELVTDVVTMTGRPDLEAKIKMAVRVATLKVHQSDFYPKDLYETGLEWTTPAYVQSLEYRAVIPRWRAFKYLRKYANGAAGDFITLLTPEQTVDGWGVDRQDVCYLAGDQLEINSSTQDNYMILGCYVNPITEEAGYSSWIALDHPYIIVYEAARAIFKQIGFDEQASQIKQELAEHYQILRQEVTAYGD